MANEFCLPREVVRTILTKDLNKPKLCETCCNVCYTIPHAVPSYEGFYSPYSPDLAPEDCFLFPRLKLTLKGHHFLNTLDIQAAITKELNTVLNEDFFKNFQNLFGCCQKCILDGGNFF